MLIPPEQLSEDALCGLIEEYVTRDGTNLDEMHAKADAVRRSIDRKQLLIVFDEVSESVNLLSPEDYQAAKIAEEHELLQDDSYSQVADEDLIEFDLHD